MDEWVPMLVIMAAAIVLAIPVFALFVMAGMRRDIERLRERVAQLELERARGEPAIHAVPAEAVPAAPPPPPIPIAEAMPEHARVAESPTPARPDRSVEQLVGGVWLQNIGSVLLLLGVFFWILWSYTTGRLGPGWLVLSGVLLGAGFVWRGDRFARAVPAFGHALVGIGLGIVYLSLYLGHFTLHALDSRLTFVALLATSLVAIYAGLHYRVQGVALLGVLGAFIPLLLAAWVPLRGFSLSPWSLIGYLAVVDLAVFALAARAGWGALDLAAVLLTTFTWVVAAHEQPQQWTLQLALSLLYTMLGLAVVPRLASVRSPVRPVELAVILIAPLCLIGASMPYFWHLTARHAAVWLFGHAVVYLLAALWAEPRRIDEALWRPLTAAATVFFTAAIALFAGQNWTPVAWCTEGSLLVWIGLGRNGWWLRVWGYVVAALGFCMLFVSLIEAGAWSNPMPPVLYAAGIRNLIALLVLSVTAARLARARPSLAPDEQAVTRGWTAVLNLLVMIWSANEAQHAARALEEPAGRWATGFAREPVPVYTRVRTLGAVLTSGAWMLQAVGLLTIGWRIGSSYARWLGLGLLGITVLKFLLFDLSQVDVFWRFLTAIVVGASLLAVSYLYQRRARTMAREVPEA
jgi:uncharacterized membrane protein